MSVPEMSNTSVRNDCEINDLENCLNNISLNSSNELTRILALPSEIKLCDSDPATDIHLYSYTSCTDDSNELVKNTRGSVFHDSTKIFSGFPYTPEYSVETFDSKKFDLANAKFYTSHEGTLVRFFFYEKWYMTTHRKLDAFRSRWGCKESFGELFVKGLIHNFIQKGDFYNAMGPECNEENILDIFKSKLDTSSQYIFLIGSTIENRIVSLPNANPIFHIGTYFPDKSFNLEHIIHLPKPTQLKFNNAEEIIAFVQATPYASSQGVIIFTGNQYTQQIKIINNQYKFLYDIRGNQPSIKFRYLQLRNDKEKVKTLYFMYPRVADTFDDYERTIYEIANKINTAYIRRFIKKTHIVVPKEEYKVMQQCHVWHVSDREHNRISLQKVTEIINQQEATVLNKMIRTHKLADKESINTRPRAHSKDINNINMDM